MKMEITKERAEEITAIWDAASTADRLTLPRVSWISVGDRVSYFEDQPTQLELKAAEEIRRLREALQAVRDEIVYGGGDAIEGPDIDKIHDIARSALAKARGEKP
jgi:hypothetical protein